MQLLTQYIDELMTVFGNMVYNDDNKISERMLEQMFPKWKQEAFFIAFNGNKYTAGNTFIHPSNYVKTEITLDQNIQEDGADFKLFLVEPAVSLNSNLNGFRFVGDRISSTSFYQFTDPNSYNWTKEAGLIGINEVAFIVTGGQMKVYGNTQLKKLFMDYIPVDVMNVEIWDIDTKSTRPFNPETDFYPISEDIWKLMKQIAIAELTPANMRPADMTNDNTNPLEKQSNA